MPNPYYAQSAKHETDKNVCSPEDSRAASWSAADGLCCWLHCAHEGADEFAVDLWANRFGIEAGGFEEFAGLVDPVNASGFHLDGFKPGQGKFFAIFIFFQCARDAADPEFHTLANIRGNVAANDNIGYREASAGLENAKRFGKDAVLVARKIDDAIGDNDVDGVIRQRNVFNGAFQKLDVRDAGLFLILPGQGQHFVGHVQAISFARGPDAFGRKDDVNAAAGAKVEHHFAGLELSEGRGIATAERSGHSFFGQGALFRVAVKVFGDGVAAAERRASAAASGAPARGAFGGLAVFLLHRFLDIGFAHGLLTLKFG